MNTSTVSKHVTRVINYRKTYAVLALAGLIASLSGAAAADNDKEATPPAGRTTGQEFMQTLEQKPDTVQRETPEESVRMLMQDRFIDMLHWNMDGGQAYIRYLERDPRVAKLLDFARNGSEDQRASLLAEVKKMCRHFIEELPLISESRYDMSPTVRNPGGAVAYPLLLSVLDDKVETLPLLLEMQARRQEALWKRRERDSEGQMGVGDEMSVQNYIGSLFGEVVAYACAKLLGRCERTPALHSALSAKQALVLAAFAEYTKRTGPIDGSTLSHDYFPERRIILFARNFVQAADR